MRPKDTLGKTAKPALRPLHPVDAIYCIFSLFLLHRSHKRSVFIVDIALMVGNVSILKRDLGSANLAFSFFNCDIVSNNFQ